jgi:membrane protein implicated in regulation of membrane protease activity
VAHERGERIAFRLAIAILVLPGIIITAFIVASLAKDGADWRLVAALAAYTILAANGWYQWTRRRIAQNALYRERLATYKQKRADLDAAMNTLQERYGHDDPEDR